MSLSDNLIEGSISFGIGFAFGAKNPCDMFKQSIDSLDAMLDDEQFAAARNARENLQSYASLARQFKWIVPAGVGYLVSAGKFIATELGTKSLGADNAARIATSIASAYIGMLAGSVLVRSKHATYDHAIQILRKMRHYPDDTIKYLPKALREELEASLQATKDRLLVQASISQEQLYSEKGTIVRNIGRRFRNTSAYGLLQKLVLDIYGSEKPLAYAVAGVANTRNVRMLISEKGEFNVQDITLKRPLHQGDLHIECIGKSAPLDISPPCSKKTVDEIIRSCRDSHTVVLLSSNSKLDDHQKDVALLEALHAEQVAHQKYLASRN